ncbi:unnamed protein product [Ixodes pacificus]
MVVDRLASLSVAARAESLKQDIGQLETQVRQLQETLDALLRLQQRSLESSLYNKANELQEDISLKRFDLHVAQIHLAAVKAQFSLFRGKEVEAVSEEKNCRDRKATTPALPVTGTIKNKWLKAFRSLKTGTSSGGASGASDKPDASDKRGKSGNSGGGSSSWDTGQHVFQEYTYKKVTACDACREILRGHVRQGLKCKLCKFNVHNECQEKAGRCQPKPRLLRRQRSASEIETKIIPAEPEEERPVTVAAGIPDAVDPIYQLLKQAGDLGGGGRRGEKEGSLAPRLSAGGGESSSITSSVASLQQRRPRSNASSSASSSSSHMLTVSSHQHHPSSSGESATHLPRANYLCRYSYVSYTGRAKSSRVNLTLQKGSPKKPAPHLPTLQHVSVSQTTRRHGHISVVVVRAVVSPKSRIYRILKTNPSIPTRRSHRSVALLPDTILAVSQRRTRQSPVPLWVAVQLRSLRKLQQPGVGTRQRRRHSGSLALFAGSSAQATLNKQHDLTGRYVVTLLAKSQTEAKGLSLLNRSDTASCSPHSPQRKKLSLRMKSLSLDSPESNEHAHRRQLASRKCHRVGNMRLGLRCLHAAPQSPVHGRRQLLSTKAVRMSSVDLPDDNEKSLSSASTSPCPSPKPHRLLPTNLYVVLYNFRSRHQDELDLKAGDTVTVIDTTDPDWWQGKCMGRSGFFPSKYVAKLHSGERALQVVHSIQVLDGHEPVKLLRDQIVIQVGDEMEGKVLVRTGLGDKALPCPLKYLQEV